MHSVLDFESLVRLFLLLMSVRQDPELVERVLELG